MLTYVFEKTAQSIGHTAHAIVTGASRSCAGQGSGAPVQRFPIWACRDGPSRSFEVNMTHVLPEFGLVGELPAWQSAAR
jgi:hypothetical protein